MTIATFFPDDLPVVVVALALLALGGVMLASVVGETADHSDPDTQGH